MKNKKPNLFHGTQLQQDSIGNYARSISGELQPRKSHPGSEAWVFATPDLLCACAYSLKSPLGDENLAQIFSLQIGNNLPPLLIFGADNVERKFALHPAGFVFQADNESFEPMVEGSKTCEWVSRKPVSKLDLVKILTPDEAMKIGIQIFLFNQGGEAGYKKYEEACSKAEDSGIERISRLCSEGLLIHLNDQKQLNPLNLETKKLADSRFSDSPELVLETPKSPENPQAQLAFFTQQIKGQQQV